MRKQFSPERLANIRRLRRARYLYRKLPLFAFEMMKAQFPGYDYQQFLEDLRYRRPPKKRKSRTGLLRYGRYSRIEQLNASYMVTGKIEFALKAMQLRRNIAKPYRVVLRLKGEQLEWQFSPLIRIERIEELVAVLAHCTDATQAQKLIDRFSTYIDIN